MHLFLLQPAESRRPVEHLHTLVHFRQQVRGKVSAIAMLKPDHGALRIITPAVQHKIVFRMHRVDVLHHPVNIIYPDTHRRLDVRRQAFKGLSRIPRGKSRHISVMKAQIKPLQRTEIKVRQVQILRRSDNEP